MIFDFGCSNFQHFQESTGLCWKMNVYPTFIIPAPTVDTVRLNLVVNRKHPYDRPGHQGTFILGEF